MPLLYSQSKLIPWYMALNRRAAMEVLLVPARAVQAYWDTWNDVFRVVK
jgi:hypothetical protein